MTAANQDDVNGAPHRCEVMGTCLDDIRIPIEYQPIYRAYVIWLERPSGKDSGLAQEIFFCPWCGQALPASLDVQLYDELTDLNQGELDDYREAIERAPEAYHSAAWWRGRYDREGKLLS
jgi:uncharacterized protein DUF6980